MLLNMSIQPMKVILVGLKVFTFLTKPNFTGSSSGSKVPKILSQIIKDFHNSYQCIADLLHDELCDETEY